MQQHPIFRWILQFHFTCKGRNHGDRRRKESSISMIQALGSKISNLYRGGPERSPIKEIKWLPSGTSDKCNI